MKLKKPPVATQRLGPAPKEKVFFLPHPPLTGLSTDRYRGGGNFVQEKFRWTNFVTRNSHQIFSGRFKKTHQIFPARNLSCQKSSAPSAPFFFLCISLWPRRNPIKFLEAILRKPTKFLQRKICPLRNLLATKFSSSGKPQYKAFLLYIWAPS